MVLYCTVHLHSFFPKNLQEIIFNAVACSFPTWQNCTAFLIGCRRYCFTKFTSSDVQQVLTFTTSWWTRLQDSSMWTTYHTWPRGLHVFVHVQRFENVTLSQHDQQAKRTKLLLSLSRELKQDRPILFKTFVRCRGRDLPCCNRFPCFLEFNSAFQLHSFVWN